MKPFTFPNHINFENYYAEAKRDICELFFLTREIENLRWRYGSNNLLLHLPSIYVLLEHIYLNYTLVCSKLKDEKYLSLVK